MQHGHPIHDRLSILVTTYHLVSVRRIIGRLSMPPRTPGLAHGNGAGEDTMRRWQHSAKKQISRMKR